MTGTPDLLSAADTALLLGVTEAELLTEWHRQQAENPGRSSLTIPKPWLLRGKEQCARLGVDTLDEALAILREGNRS